MKCRICQTETKKVQESQIMGKYQISYFHCENCDFLQTETPYWLTEAYQNPINDTDIGLLWRNLRASNVVSSLIFFGFKGFKKAKFLDYAAGYGVFTRLMRDRGFQFFWHDPYTKNLFANGFEANLSKENYLALTTFESFEHFENPIAELEKMLQITDTIIFSTELRPKPIPSIEEWEYYGINHGQHVAFYSVKTFRFIAKMMNLHYYNFGNIHLITRKSNIFLKILPKSILGKIILTVLSLVPRIFLKSLLMEDFYLLKNKKNSK